MLGELTSEQFAEWQAYESLEPWSEDRADLRAGIIASACLAPWRKKGAPPPNPQDFMPDFAGDRRGRRRARAEQIEAAKAIALTFGGRVQ